ncbi:hypothetical protein J6590_095572 [Homalodisca vitripennis]|nr:hypothetical protein J6590_095572 [Homalodisca vitripennis]
MLAKLIYKKNEGITKVQVCQRFKTQDYKIPPWRGRQTQTPNIDIKLSSIDDYFCLGRPPLPTAIQAPSLLPVSIFFLKKFAEHDVPRVDYVIGYPISMDKDHDVFWASNSTAQQPAGKTVSVNVNSDKTDCLTLTLVTGHRACEISGLTSPYN